MGKVSAAFCLLFIWYLLYYIYIYICIYIYIFIRTHSFVDVKAAPAYEFVHYQVHIDKEDRQQGRTEKNERRDKQRKKTT